MRDGVEEHELFDFSGEGEENGGHYVREVLGKGLDVGARLRWRTGGGEIVFGGFDEVVDFGVDEFEDTLFGCFFMGAEGFCGSEGDGGGCGLVRGGASGHEEGFKFGAGGFEVRDVDQDLNDLAEVLGGEFGDERGADFGGEEVVEGGFKTFVDDFGVAEVRVVDEEVELVEKVANVDAAQWVHLREGEDARESHLGDRPVWRVPADIDNLLVFLSILDRHRHVVVCGHNFEKIIAEATFQEVGILVEEDKKKSVGGDGWEIPTVHGLVE